MQFGRTFEEFEVGDVYRHWPGKTVTESDDHLFCLITMNHHPLHLDAHYAEHVDPVRAQRRRRQPRSTRCCWACRCRTSGQGHRQPRGRVVAARGADLPRGHDLRRDDRAGQAREPESADDRGVVQVETRGYNQDGTLVCIFRRGVLVPTQSYLDAAGGDQPGRPTPL